MVLWRQSYLSCLRAAREVYYCISAALSLGSWALPMFMGQRQLEHVQDAAKTCFYLCIVTSFGPSLPPGMLELLLVLWERVTRSLYGIPKESPSPGWGCKAPTVPRAAAGGNCLW